MAPIARGLVCVAVSTAAAAVAAHCSAGDRACRARDPGVVLLQRSSLGVTKSAMPTTDESLAELHTEVGELKTLVLNLQQMLSDNSTLCCSGCGGGGGGPPGGPGKTEPDQPGLCAMFGDPHTTTFDGAHTILLKDQSMWVIRSQDVWVQALARTVLGNLMGLAVGGPFMQGHSLVIYNTTLLPRSELSTRLKVLFDGKEILQNLDAEGDAEFEEPFLMWGARRSDWNTSLHDNAVLGIKQAVNWDVGSWPSRFTQSPIGGLYYFKLPNDVEITLSGVDFMTAVIKAKPRPGGQTGFCGNFNGIAEDEFAPPPPGAVPDVLMPAWNTAVGPDLDPIDSSLNIFSQVVPALMTSFAQVALQPTAHGALAGESPCPDVGMLQQGESECGEIPDLDLRAACIADFCLTGSKSAVDAVALAGVMEAKMSDGRQVLFVGHGTCRDVDGKAFRVIELPDVRNEADCQKVLSQLGGVKGVVGAQLQREGTCQLVVDADARDFDLTDVLPKHHMAFVQAMPTAEDSKASFVAGSEKDLSWSCWRLN